MAATYVVRFGRMRLLGVFRQKDSNARYRRDQEVIVRTDRGMEAGTVLSELPGSGEDVRGVRGQVLRPMSADDRLECRRLAEGSQAEFEICHRLIQKRQLAMQLIDVEHIFGGERVIFYFLADGRVDFRDLVKDLAREYQTRIEMRQIGVRDESKLLADFGDCGMACCCGSFMGEMPPVSMKMAKMQKATLDPAKISGRCSRLKCCLRFEDDNYEALRRELPPMGMRVRTESGTGVIIGHEILAQRVMIEFEDGRRLAVEGGDILEQLERVRRSSSSRRKRPSRGGDKTPKSGEGKKGR